jgi:diguanylate cyclase (GGDEF)-like protein
MVITASPFDRPEGDRRSAPGRRSRLERRVGERRLAALPATAERREAADRRAAAERRRQAGRRRAELDLPGVPVVLYVGGDRSDARFLERLLDAIPEERFRLEAVEQHAAALERISRGDVDAVLLDLGPGGGLGAFRALAGAGASAPFVIVSAAEDQRRALEAVRAGAQDFLVKGRFDGPLLARAVRYAIERHRLRNRLEDELLLDDLTGLYNRRGFATLATQDLRLARRGREDLLLAFADLDDLKVINDTWGHAAGDRALRDVAGVLRRTFRDSDLMARIGGDEYAVLVRGCEPNAVATLRERLNDELHDLHRRAKRPYRISTSLGFARAAGATVPSVESLLRRADRALYREKRRRDLQNAKAAGRAAVRRPYEARPIDILLIEDDPTDAELAHLALQRARVQNRLAVVRDGTDGLAYVRGEPPFAGIPRPDVVLLDLNLPGRDGRAVLAELRHDPELADLPVVVLTSSGAEQGSLAELRPDGYLVKPVDFDRLTQAVQAVANLGFTIVKLPA